MALDLTSILARFGAVKLPDAELVPTGDLPDPIEDMEDTPTFKAAQFETDARVRVVFHLIILHEEQRMDLPPKCKTKGS